MGFVRVVVFPLMSLLVINLPPSRAMRRMRWCPISLGPMISWTTYGLELSGGASQCARRQGVHDGQWACCSCTTILSSMYLLSLKCEAEMVDHHLDSVLWIGSGVHRVWTCSSAWCYWWLRWVDFLWIVGSGKVGKLGQKRSGMTVSCNSLSVIGWLWMFSMKKPWSSVCLGWLVGTVLVRKAVGWESLFSGRFPGAVICRSICKFKQFRKLWFLT
jgi:hypothetical protein